MASGRPGLLKIVVYGLCTIACTVLAAPSVAFPFNSQVPTVARVGQLYRFQLSPSTFAPETANFTYSVSNQPGWLSLDSATRTLSGTPSQADVGSARFTLTAADIDGVAHMLCTLVVSKDPAPQIGGEIGEQLATIANLSSNKPPVAMVPASSQFRFQFKQGSFIDIVQRKLYYYATLTDHTPLPSWLQFDAQSMTFSGHTPPLAALPQSWNIELIASDVEGFAGAGASFTIAIASQQLAFIPESQHANVTAGEFVEYTSLQDSLFSNGKKLAPMELKSAKASMPPWLSFDPATLEISGTAPADVKATNVTVTVEDKLGNRATILIQLVPSSFDVFAGTIGTLTAHAGQDFNYHFSDALFTGSNTNIQVILPASATWLQYDADTRELSGKAPIQTSSSLLQGKIVARSEASTQEQTQTFAIKIIPSLPASPTAQASATSSAAATDGTAPDRPKSHSHLNSGIVAAVVLGCLLAAAILAACLAFLRRRKRNKDYVEQTSPTRRTISRPTLPLEADAIRVTTELQRDSEKTADRDVPECRAREAEPAPQIALNIPANTHGKRLKWSKRFSPISQTSSLGNGEDAIRADSNIPEWGRQSKAFHNPHESFSIPTEMARSSKQITESSQNIRPAKRTKKRNEPSAHNIGLGIDTGDTTILSRSCSRGARSHRRAPSSMGLSVETDRSSVASLSTRGTSVLSARPSDFPRPPTRSTFEDGRSKSRKPGIEDKKRKSIRLVEHSDSVADDRSMHEKRRSFIRNRASASFASPLFANGARVPSAKQTGRGSLNGPSLLGQRRSQRNNSQITTYSESSSLEPPPRDPRRLSTKVRRAFAPNFPRAITNTTLGADEEGYANGDTSSFYTTESSISDHDYTAEMALPRHERSWVLPGEASPTPPPASIASRQGSSARRTTPTSTVIEPQQRSKTRLREHSSSPLSTALAVPRADHDSLSASARTSQARRSRLSEPMSLVSNDSLSRTTPERPRLVQTKSRRPVSIEKVQRLGSLKAEAEDARPESEVFEAMQGAGLIAPNSVKYKDSSQRSNLSGPAFL